jgi:hypothetical protein
MKTSTLWRLFWFAAFVLISAGIFPLAVAQKSSKASNVRDDRAIYVPGSSSCGLWLEVREHPRPNDARLVQFESFLFGYASAYNWYVDGPRRDGMRNVLHVDVYGQRAFIDKYCREHPTDVFLNAVNALIQDLDR